LIWALLPDRLDKARVQALQRQPDSVVAEEVEAVSEAPTPIFLLRVPHRVCPTENPI
jgi:hypothetical protein